MFKQIVCVCFVLFFLLSGKGFSEEADFIPISSGVSVGVRGSWMKWEAQESYSGYMVGPSAAIDYRKSRFVYGGARFFLTYGDLDNDICVGKRAQLFNLEGRIGYSFGSNFILTPYTGAGVIISNLRLKDKQGMCYREAFTNIYIPIGGLMTYHFSDTFSIGIDYEYMPAVDSFAREAGYKNVRWDLHKKGSQSVEMPIQFVFPNPRFKGVQYRLTPFFRTYSYGSGKIKCNTCVSGSANISKQWAYEIGIKYDIVFF